MICAACNRLVPDNLIDCPVCAMRRSDVHVRTRQYEALLMVEAGRGELIGHRLTDGNTHIKMFGSDLCFCGQPATAIPRRRRPMEWGANVFVGVCSKCREAIEAILAEARAAHREQQH